MTQQKPELSLIEKFREECLKRGASGIKSIGRLFVQLDDNRSGDLTFKEFENGILNHNIKVSKGEIVSLFREFDKDSSGLINYNEFIEQLRPPLNKNRLNLIKMAFDKLDKTSDGQITIEDLKNVYNVKKNPKFINGEWTEDQCLRKFLDSFDAESHKDGVVTYDEFVSYYSAVSASIDSDPYFDVMMRQAWKL